MAKLKIEAKQNAFGVTELIRITARCADNLTARIKTGLRKQADLIINSFPQEFI